MNAPMLVGYVPVIEGIPSFGIPVFEKDGSICVQEIDGAGRISGFLDQNKALMSRFQPIQAEVRPISRFAIGDEAYFVFDTLGKVVAGTGPQVALKIVEMQHEFPYQNYPFLFFEIADFCALYLEVNRKPTMPPLRLADVFGEVRQKQALQGGLLEKRGTGRVAIYTLFRNSRRREEFLKIGRARTSHFHVDLGGRGSVAALESTLRFVERQSGVGLLICNIATEDRLGEDLANQFSQAGLTRVDIQTPLDYQRLLTAADMFAF